MIFKCPHCSESFPLRNCSATFSECTHKKDKRQPKLYYSHENNMDPGNVPDQLQNLTQVEGLLMASVVPMSVRHGQYGYSGHVLNLAQDVSFACKLPRTTTLLNNGYSVIPLGDFKVMFIVNTLGVLHPIPFGVWL